MAIVFFIPLLLCYGLGATRIIHDSWVAVKPENRSIKDDWATNCVDCGKTQLQPFIAYQLEGGWASSAGDLQFVYEWKRSEWVSIPIGFQIGAVRSIGGQAFRFSLNPQWNLKDISGSVKSKLVFTIALLAPAG